MLYPLLGCRGVHRVNSISIRTHPLNTPTPASLSFQLQSAGTHIVADNDYWGTFLGRIALWLVLYQVFSFVDSRSPPETRIKRQVMRHDWLSNLLATGTNEVK
jgi:hypothetical protein